MTALGKDSLKQAWKAAPKVAGTPGDAVSRPAKPSRR